MREGVACYRWQLVLPSRHPPLASHPPLQPLLPCRHQQRRPAPALASSVSGAAAGRERPPGTGRGRRLSKQALVEVKGEVHQMVRQLLGAGKPQAAAALLQECLEMTGQRLDSTDTSCELVLALIDQANTEAALAVMPAVTPSRGLLRRAIRAFAGKRSARGVTFMLHRLPRARQPLLAGPESRDVWIAAIEAYGGLGRLEEARKAFVSMRQAGAWAVEDTHAVNVLLHALHTDVRLAFIRCRQLLDEGMSPDTSTFNLLLKAAMRARDAKRAELALSWMQQAELQGDEITFNSLIKCHSYAGDLEAALKVREVMQAEGFMPTPRIWGSLFLACASAQQLEMAGILWWEAKQLQGAGGGVQLTTDNLNAMMSACNTCYQGERALRVMQEAVELGIQADARTYNIALKACESIPGKTLKQDQLVHAFSLREQMKAAGLQPDTYTYATLFHLCAEARQGRCALQLAEEMEAEGVLANVVSMTALIRALGASGLVEECMGCFRRMVWGPARLKPNRGTFKALIGVLRANGALGHALRVYDAMRKSGHAPDNTDFQELTAAAAEAALTQEDSALQEQVASVCNVNSCERVDLHGMSVYEARAAVLVVLAMVQQAYRRHGALRHGVTIITGRGEHSEQRGQSVVRNAVIRMLEEELQVRPLCLEEGVAASSSMDGIKERQPGDPPPNDNPGRVVIQPDTLLSWIRQRCISRQLRGQDDD